MLPDTKRARIPRTHSQTAAFHAYPNIDTAFYGTENPVCIEPDRDNRMPAHLSKCFPAASVSHHVGFAGSRLKPQIHPLRLTHWIGRQRLPSTLRRYGCLVWERIVMYRPNPVSHHRISILMIEHKHGLLRGASFILHSHSNFPWLRFRRCLYSLPPPPSHPPPHLWAGLA